MQVYELSGIYGKRKKEPVIRVDKSKESFYRTLNISQGLRNTINIYNYLKNL